MKNVRSIFILGVLVFALIASSSAIGSDLGWAANISMSVYEVDGAQYVPSGEVRQLLSPAGHSALNGTAGPQELLKHGRHSVRLLAEADAFPWMDELAVISLGEVGQVRIKVEDAPAALTGVHLEATFRGLRFPMARLETLPIPLGGSGILVFGTEDTESCLLMLISVKPEIGTSVP